MPKTPNTISFGPSQQDLQAQQLELQRRQQFADMLRAQSLAPIEQQVVSGQVVKNSPWLGVTKLAQALLAKNAQEGNAEREAALGKAAAERQAAALRSLAPEGTFDEPQHLGMGLTSESVGEQPKVDAATKARWAKLLAANAVDPQLGRDLLKNELSMTDEQKNLATQGIDPRAFGQARLSGEQAKALQNVAPGTTVFNSATRQPIFAAPDFGAGIQGQFDPSGSPQMGRIQGSEVIGQMAGDKARQEAAGRAGFNTITVNTPNGPVLMTEEQAARMAGGARPAQQPAQGAPVSFTASNGVAIDIANKTPQQIVQAAQASGDPQVMQAVGEWMNSGSQPQQQVGIPLQTEAQKEAEIRAVQNAADIEKDLRIKAQSPEAQAAYKDLGSTVKLANAAEPLLQSATGSTLGSLRDKAYGVVGASTKASQAAAQLKVIGGELVGKVPRFSGPTSDSDRKFYIEMAGRVGDETAPVGDRIAALQTLRQFASQRMQEQAGSMPAQAVEAVRNPSAQPSIDDLMKKYGGR